MVFKIICLSNYPRVINKQKINSIQLLTVYIPFGGSFLFCLQVEFAGCLCLISSSFVFFLCLQIILFYTQRHATATKNLYKTLGQCELIKEIRKNKMTL